MNNIFFTEPPQNHTKTFICSEICGYEQENVGMRAIGHFTDCFTSLVLRKEKCFLLSQKETSVFTTFFRITHNFFTWQVWLKINRKKIINFCYVIYIIKFQISQNKAHKSVYFQEIKAKFDDAFVNCLGLILGNGVEIGGAGVLALTKVSSPWWLLNFIETLRSLHQLTTNSNTSRHIFSISNIQTLPSSTTDLS